jgi:hypothetical protein
MSGPKCNCYRLTKEQEALLREQALLEQRRCEKEGVVADILRRIEAMSGFFKESETVAREFFARENKGVEALSSIAAFETAINKALKSSFHKDASLDVLLKVEAKLNAALADINERRSRLLLSLAKLRADFDNALSGDIQALRSREVARFADNTEAIDRTAENGKKVLLSELANLKAATLTADDHLIQRIDDAITFLSALGDADSVSIKNFKDVTIPSIRKEIQMRDLDRRIEEKRKTYIAKSLDEAMSELGYEIVGRSDKNSLSEEVFDFDDGNFVIVSHDGDKITMEVTKFDNTDVRQPTASEAESELRAMNQLCQIQDEFENLLFDRGILVERLKWLPASMEFAQVLDAAEFGIQDISVLKTKTRRSLSQRKKHTDNAVKMKAKY